MNIGVAQIRPLKGDVIKNSLAHQRFIELAAIHKADALFFPELSLTGYEPELANELATTEHDELFEPFQHLSNKHRMILGLGMPTRSENGIHISMIILQPNKPIQVYSKVHLHEDEFPYFVNGQNEVLIHTPEHIIAPAICYESLLPQHVSLMAEKGANVYLASVAKSTAGLEKAFRHYPEMAKRYRMPVLMTNSVGPCDNFESAGHTASWDAQGKLLAELNQTEEGILLLNTKTNQVQKLFLP